MAISKRISNKLETVRNLGFCPSILNLYVDRYSFKFLLNDIFSGFKMFLFLFPIAFALSYFCGSSPVQGLIACLVGGVVSVLLGGSKYQIISVSLPVTVITLEILSKYQYKGLFYTALFVSLILFLFGVMRLSKVLKHISYAFIAALTIYVILSILMVQTPYLLGISSIQSSQSLIENYALFKESLGNISQDGVYTFLGYLFPLAFLRYFTKGPSSYFIYLLIGCLFTYISDLNLVPNLFEIKTIGKELLAANSVGSFLTMSNVTPSQVFLSNTMNYAFVIAIIIACEASFCTNVTSSITGDRRLQHNIELISSGIANLASVMFGGLFVSPNINHSMKNIEGKAKTILPALIATMMFLLLLVYIHEILQVMPINCISSILIVFACAELKSKKLLQYMNVKAVDSYIFWITLIVAIYFGFIPATIVGFTMSCVMFSNRMVKIKDATVHTTQNHDSEVIEFMTNKNGFANSLNISKDVLSKIEIVHVDNVLFLNIAKVVEESLLTRGKFPRAILVYFNNVPYLDTEAFLLLKQLVKNAKEHNAIVMVSGTNGRLLDILKEKAEKEKSEDAYGYIIPNFQDAISQITKRLEK